MSNKSIDFETGGAFIEGKNGDRINIDDSVEIGDVIIYDGQTFHGVEDIDPHKRLCLNSINGRLAGFVYTKKWTKWIGLYFPNLKTNFKYPILRKHWKEFLFVDLSVSTIKSFINFSWSR